MPRAPGLVNADGNAHRVYSVSCEAATPFSEFVPAEHRPHYSTSRAICGRNPDVRLKAGNKEDRPSRPLSRARPLTPS